MRTQPFFLAATVAVALLSQPAIAATNSVSPGDDIQAAVDGATDGDTIELAAGTYFLPPWEQINVSKSITIRGVGGRDLTIVDGGYSTRGFYLNAPNIVIEGLTIQQCFENEGAGIYFAGGAGTIIRDCAIVNNFASYGGGVWCNGPDTIQFINCDISGNMANEGGAIECNSGSVPVFRNCVIENNFAYQNGGAIASIIGDPTFDGCQIRNNETMGNGGAIWVHSSIETKIMRCSITGNVSIFGGGIWTEGQSTPLIFSCLIAGNESLVEAGGIGIQDGPGPLIYNCTIVNNTAATIGGGVLSIYGGEGVVRNSIIRGNYPDQVMVTEDSYTSFDYCNIEGLGGVVIPPQYLGPNNIDEPSGFVDEAGGDYRLTSQSKCRDAGLTEPWMYAETDRAGGPRVFGSQVDLGAYEWSIPHLRSIIEIILEIVRANDFNGESQNALINQLDSNGNGDALSKIDDAEQNLADGKLKQARSSFIDAIKKFETFKNLVGNAVTDYPPPGISQATADELTNLATLAQAWIDDRMAEVGLDPYVR
mgnify:CR=1 FL=1